MKDSWIQSIITQDQFQKIDRWIYTLMIDHRTADPLKDLNYFILIRKVRGLKREVVFSPNCYHRLCEILVDFSLLETRVIPKPDVLRPLAEKEFVFWFGDVHHFIKIFPPEDLSLESKNV